MDLATIIKSNNNFIIKNGYLYNIHKEKPLCTITNLNHYEYGTHLTFYKQGVRIKNDFFGKIEFSFYNNNGILLSHIKEDFKEMDNEIDMIIFENGILAVTKAFSPDKNYLWTSFNGIQKSEKDFNEVKNIINNNEQNLNI